MDNDDVIQINLKLHRIYLSNVFLLFSCLYLFPKYSIQLFMKRRNGNIYSLLVLKDNFVDMLEFPRNFLN